MSAVPSASAVTRPAADTVATFVAEDCHVACWVTSDVDPLLNVAVAASCRVCPASIVPDASPVARTWTVLVVGDGVVGGAGDVSEPQATTPMARLAARRAHMARATTGRLVMHRAF